MAKQVDIDKKKRKLEEMANDETYQIRDSITKFLDKKQEHLVRE